MKIHFFPIDKTIEGNPDKSLLQLATENGIVIKSVCKGVPSCTECRIKIKDGDSNTLPPTKAELSLIGTNHHIDGKRLACQVRCFGDMTVDMTEQIERGEAQSKKIRGFKSTRQAESKAVQDTMILTQKNEFEKK